MKDTDPISAIIFSPHPDDAAFSLGGSLIKRTFGETVLVLTVFGHSNYANGQFKSDDHCVTRLRFEEDKAWASVAGVDIESLPLPEASIRLGNSFEAIFASPPHVRSKIRSIVSSEIEAFIATYKPRILISPLGLGGHSDHIIVSEEVQKLGEQFSIPVAYYEDLPYAFHKTKEEIFQLCLKRLKFPQYTTILLSGALNEKLNHLTKYESQIHDRALKRIKIHANRIAPFIGGERIWHEKGITLSVQHHIMRN